MSNKTLLFPSNSKPLARSSPKVAKATLATNGVFFAAPQRVARSKIHTLRATTLGPSASFNPFLSLLPQSLEPLSTTIDTPPKSNFTSISILSRSYLCPPVGPRPSPKPCVRAIFVRTCENFYAPTHRIQPLGTTHKFRSTYRTHVTPPLLHTPKHYNFRNHLKSIDFLKVNDPNGCLARPLQLVSAAAPTATESENRHPKR